MTTYTHTGNTTSSNDSDTQNVDTVDTVVATVTARFGLVVQSTSNCSASVVGGGSFTSTITCTVNSFSAGSYSVVFYQSYGAKTYTLTGTATAPITITAPVISSISNNNAKAANVTATVNLSSNGSGGTLRYAQSTSNSVPSSGWQASASFTHPRNATRYYWASQSQNTAGAFDGGDSHAVGYRNPVKSLYVSDATITASATSHTFTAGSTGAGDQYQVWTHGYMLASSSVVTATGSSTSLTMTQYLPSAGSSADYIVRCRAPLSNGGDNSWQTFFNNTSPSDRFTVTRQAVVDTTPAPFSFTAVTSSGLNTTHTTYAQILDINTATNVTSNNCAFQVTSSTATPSSFSTSAKTITNGQYLHLQDAASGSYSTTISTVMTVGTLSSTWSITTGPADTTANQFYFQNISGATGGSTQYAVSTAISGINTGVSVTRTAGTGTFAISSSTSVPSSGSFTSSAKTVTNGQYIHVKDTASSTAFQCKRTIISAGGKSNAFSVTSAAGFTTDTIVSQGLYYYSLSSSTGSTYTVNVANGETIKLTHNSNAGGSIHRADLDSVHGSFTLVNCSADSTTNIAQTDQATSGRNGLKVTISGTSGATYSCAATYSFSGVVHTFTLTGTIDPPSYGMEVYDQSGNVRLAFNKRQARLHGRFSGTVTGSFPSSFNQYYAGYGVGGLGQWFGVNTANSSNYFVQPAASSTNNVYMQRASVRTQNASYQIFSGNEDYDVLVFRY